jgi:dipeptidyl aminopeptidase/acylaminoacyl peptidase
MLAHYGSWKSQITSDSIVADSVGLEDVQLDGDTVYWVETRPKDGRSVVVRHTAAGVTEDVTPAPFSARSRVHEYGGGACLVNGGIVYFTNFADQQLYSQLPGAAPSAITHNPRARYADTVLDRDRSRLITIREEHPEDAAVTNTLVSIALASGDEAVLAAGNDFYCSPCLSPDGEQLAWLTWNHPEMPWTGTELWVGKLTEDGTVCELSRIAGGPGESIFQPSWSPDGRLYFVSDRTGWWNLYRFDGADVAELWRIEAEFGQPQWYLGMSTYSFVSPATIAASYITGGVAHLALLNAETFLSKTLDLPFQDISAVRAGRRIVFRGGAFDCHAGIVRVDPETGDYAILKSATYVAEGLPAYFSVPEPIEFPTEGGLFAHALYYPPRNPDFEAPADTRPPLIVKSHGGPTAAASRILDLRTQYWTSRGFAVVDVDYGGSTGYGRTYRERLHLQWGIVDVADCINAARFLINRGDVDPSKMAITGGSAGGYTTLCALTFARFFQSGASHYGIGDLEVLARDTHKFEARYMDWLVGPYPEQQELYRQRSPIHHVDRLSVPVAFFHGAKDQVVPPNQAELMADAIRAKGLAVSFLLFEDEFHGFRKAENIKRALDGELYFYATLLLHRELRF